MRLFLIGFMGSGKSFTGKKLANLLNVPFIDLDEEIENLAGKSIPKIFEEEGEAVFRKIEQKALYQTHLQSKAVIACGGGTPCFFDNIEWMNQNGICIYLKAAPEILFNRLNHEKEYRPLLRNLSEDALRLYIHKKIQERETYYLKASAVYEQDHLFEDVACNLMQELPNIIGH